MEDDDGTTTSQRNIDPSLGKRCSAYIKAVRAVFEDRKK